MVVSLGVPIFRDFTVSLTVAYHILCEIVWNSYRIVLILFQNKYDPQTALVQPQISMRAFKNSSAMLNEKMS